MNLQLKEILWEITNQCSKNCKYCGSKEIMSKKKPSEEDILNIADKIIEYPPETVTITGGEPIEIGGKLLNKVINKLNANDIKVKILSNGQILNHETVLKNTNLSNIGLSVNNKEDINYIKAATKIKTINEIHNYIGTIITNFGTHNIWEFNDIAEFVKNFKYWQIQLTMGNDLQLPKDGIKTLKEKIAACKNSNIVLADNLQEIHSCSAGINCCSITFNGDVIHCLSQRAYNNKGIEPQGNLHETVLKTIWENEFKKCRFDCTRKCCRNYIDYKRLSKESPMIYLWDEF